MKRKVLAGLVILVLVAFLAGCFTTPVAVTTNPLGAKTGSASCLYVLSVLPLGDWDTSIYKAAKNGGITKISTVDSQLQFYYLWSVRTTIVTGD